jgi:hypothetical protein
VAEVGIGQVATLVLDRYDETTSATLVVWSPPDPVDGLRRQVPAVAVSSDGHKTWTAVVDPYDVGGLWYQEWTVTGTGKGRIVNEVPVAPDRMAVPDQYSYATSADLAAYMRDEPPPDCERMLADATREIDLMLLTARYCVDDQGFPSDPGQRQAVRDAVCELVAWWNDTGDPSGALDVYSSLSAGSISIGRATGRVAAGQAKSASTRISPQVAGILRAAGLSQQPPDTW